ncbi:MAG: tyrosine--tRNA ligase [Candidatus Limnocylindria bacterium]
METADSRTAVLDDLTWRRMIAQSTDLDALRTEMAGGPVTFYGGFDPTAPSLHFGNLVLLVTMRRLQRAGHRPIGLVGGATGLVGDPSGRTSERTLQPADVIEEWVERIRTQVERYLDFEGPNAASIVNNLDWTARMSAIEWLRDIGKHFSVSRMLAKEAVSARLEAGGISYTEFSYQVMQAVDFLELYRRHGCTLQLGGSDQWGNLTAGTDLIRRVEGATVNALATPLITRPDGEKFGKSEGSTLWLDPALTTPFAFYQWFLNVDDSVVGTYLRVFSFSSHDEIEGLEASVTSQPDARTAQRALALEVTDLVHGGDEARRVEEASEALFGRGDLRALDAATLESAMAGLPRAEIGGANGLPPVLDLLVETGLADSRGSARRVLAEGGVYLNNERVADPAAVPTDADLLGGRWLLLRRGKRNIAVAEVTR